MENISNTVLELTHLWVPKITIAFVILLLFWIISKITGKTIVTLGENTSLDNNVMNLISRTIKILLIVCGIITAFGTLGINVSALVAGLGLTGFAVGFALKDTISNLLSGVLLLLYHPFTINDRIEVAGKEGIVMSIDLRYTTLKTEHSRILIPNSALFSNSITILELNKNELDSEHFIQD